MKLQNRLSPSKVIEIKSVITWGEVCVRIDCNGQSKPFGGSKTVRYLHLSKCFKFYTYNECILFHVNYNSIRLFKKAEVY